MGKGEGHGLIEQILAGTVAHERAALKGGGHASRGEGAPRRGSRIAVTCTTR
jgi:hypothetical protein